MPKKTDPKVEGLVLGLSEGGIVARLTRDSIILSRQTVSNIVNCKGKRRQAKPHGLQSPAIYQPPKVVLKAIQKKIALLTMRENPPTQRELACKLKVSQSTINR